MRRVNLASPELRCLLQRSEKPGRYVGGEYGAVSREPLPDDYNICVVFPDLYEIGMSNQALRILYKIFNETEGLYAERAFSPAEDFGEGLKESGINLFSLESGYEVRDFNLLAITIGYELGFTNFLDFLNISGVPVSRLERGEEHPLVLLGGPAMTNPVPWSDYVDAVFIGEAEGVLASSVLRLKAARNEGMSRADLTVLLGAMPGFWTPGSPAAERQMWMGFGEETGPPAAFPIPSLAPVQDHGVIEIMRGCPNKCRFCHAGVFYRPFRQKSLARIVEEAGFLVDECGYRTITLSSLSTGDYRGLEPLVERLNSLFAHRYVSFSLPSLRVNSVTLSLLGRLGAVRKSGLTFAVETPTLAGQRGINKEVGAEHVVAILKEAKQQGWRQAKFYFMTGLPVEGDDPAEIVDYLLYVQRETRMNLNVNLGIFIPKPHTPYERTVQLGDEEAMERIRALIRGLKVNRRISFSFQSPFVSFLEGILSRGDVRAGRLGYDAWLRGAKFDAWDDKMNKVAWKEAIAGANWDVEAECCGEHRGLLPWENVSLGVRREYSLKEYQRSERGELTPPCDFPCGDFCGVCGKHVRVRPAEDTEPAEGFGKILTSDGPVPEEDGMSSAPISAPEANSQAALEVSLKKEGGGRRLLLVFTKTWPAVYLGHLDTMNVFEKALLRAGLAVGFTRGFNPKPRLEFAQPLPLGMASEGEVCSFELEGGDAEAMRVRLNEALPGGFYARAALWLPEAEDGRKVPKVMSVFWGSRWRVSLGDDLNAVFSKRADFERLDELFAAECAARGVENDAEIAREGRGWRIQFRAGGTQHHNLKRVLEGIIGGPPLALGWEITRTACLAKGADGEPIGYERVFAL
ncbi:MAG: hypothetical protein B0D92_07995 [Spirochaeta sp. LUC14_002_19_P3]|nr:MAG: hypothetical protein B0D92_07995 [Spirochaeta sp. LUC14_002_19_P3]